VEQTPPHVPVLYREVLTLLGPRPGGRYVDCTVGAGGHAEGLLKASAPDGWLLGLDVDPAAIEISRRRLLPFGDRAVLVRSNYVHLVKVATARGFDQVDGILFDLGVSSIQLDRAERGFSFQSEGPLDMRLDPSRPVTAADLVNSLSEQELADLIYRYGEEPASRSIARAIVAARPLRTTSELAEIVARTVPRSRTRTRQGRHPATRVFQALRIAVNAELENLEKALRDALDLLKPGGRLAVIAFHSLEDRIAKQVFARESMDCICPPERIVCTCGHRRRVERVTRRPVRPGAQEVTDNPRSRSARLRVVARI